MDERLWTLLSSMVVSCHLQPPPDENVHTEGSGLRSINMGAVTKYPQCSVAYR